MNDRPIIDNSQHGDVQRASVARHGEDGLPEAVAPMRVVVVGPAPPMRGGIARHTAGLVDALRRRGHDVKVMSYRRLYPRALFPGRTEFEPGAEKTDAYGRDRRSDGGGCAWAIRRNGGEPTSALDTLAPATWMRARRALSATPCDVVVLQWWHPVVAPALALVAGAARCPVVVVCHNVVPHEPFPAAAVLARIVLARARLAVCHSRAVSQSIARLAPGLRIARAAMPLLLAPPASLSQQGVAVDAAPARGGVLFAGMVRRYKGVDVLLEAWGRARLPDSVVLTIAGESYLGRGRLERMAGACGRRNTVRLIDRYVPDDELWALLRQASVVVLPYRRASQSGLLPLAVAAGARVIASDAGGLAETIAGDSRHHVVRAGDAGALARALELVVANGSGASASYGPQDSIDASRHELESQNAAARSWRDLLAAIEGEAAQDLLPALWRGDGGEGRSWGAMQ